MACSPEILRGVPLFALLDDDETAVLAGQVEVKTFTPRQRIWKRSGRRLIGGPWSIWFRGFTRAARDGRAIRL